ncbi:DNA -binding domain-containing protein [Phenylobacterium sp.]|uniref:DNA -binding domain-containing protein n=1 Tax=Phenylobacterium sp. TaxID=1871053 RepID=UPI003524F386
MVRAEDAGPEAPTFDLWALPGRKRLVHDGARLTLAGDAPAGPIRAVLTADLAHGRPYGYAVPAGEAARERLGAIEAFQHRARRAAAVARPFDRGAMAHLKAIQALDAQAAGAAHREIAAALFGHAAVAGRWSPDGDLRAQVRDALARGRAFRDGRWRELVWPSARGRFSEDAQSP